MRNRISILLIMLAAFGSAVAQTTPPSFVRGTDSRTQVDNYLTSPKRFGFPTGSTLTLDGTTSPENTAKLFWRTSDSTLQVYIPSLGTWLRAGGRLSDYITRGGVLPLDLGMSTNNTVPVRGNGNVWIYRGVSGTPSQGAIPLWTSGGQLMTGTATTNGSAVNLGQLNDSLSAIPIPTLQQVTTAGHITDQPISIVDNEETGYTFDIFKRGTLEGLRLSDNAVGSVDETNIQPSNLHVRGSLGAIRMSATSGGMALGYDRGSGNSISMISASTGSGQLILPAANDTLATVGRLSGYLPLTGNTSGTPMTGGIHMGGQGIFNARIFGAIAQEVNGWGELGIGSNNPNSWGDFRLARYYNTDTARLQLVAPTNKSGTSQAKQFWYAVNNSLSGDQNATVSAFLGSVTGRMPTSVGNGSGYAGSFVTQPFLSGTYLPLAGGQMSGNINMNGNDVTQARSYTGVISGSSVRQFTAHDGTPSSRAQLWSSTTTSGLSLRRNSSFDEHTISVTQGSGQENTLLFTGPLLGTSGSSNTGNKLQIFGANNSIADGNVNVEIARFFGSVRGRMDGTSQPNGYEGQFSTQPYVDATVGKMFTYTASGDGTTATFSAPHGLSYTPTMVMVTPNSADVLVAPKKVGVSTVEYAAAGYYVTLDATNVNIIYYPGNTGVMAPPAGTDNLKWTILVK